MDDSIDAIEGSLSFQLIESLLYQNEGTALDFKSKQYRFDAASDEEKSELLKDILAFSNSWRQTDAFILIGIQTVNGGRHNLIGTEDHFDDAQLQQFVNSKTNRKVLFSYGIVLVEGKKIGVIRIFQQKRPIYLEKNYGKINKETVYFRLGSSTAIATPEDIAKMGEDTVLSQAIPFLDLNFADLENRINLGKVIEVRSIVFDDLTKPIIEDIENNNVFYSSSSLRKNNFEAKYWQKLEKYIRISGLLQQPQGLVIFNQGNNLAKNVRVEIIGSSKDGLIVMDENNFPEKPSHTLIAISSHLPRKQQKINIAYHGNEWTLTVDLGNVQPQSRIWASESFYIGSKKQRELELEAFIYADNLPQPQKVSLNINFNIINKPELTFKQLNDLKLKLDE